MNTKDKDSDTKSAIEYHKATKHSETSIRTGGRELDWLNKPRPFKVYLDDHYVFTLGREFPQPKMKALDAVEEGSYDTVDESIDANRLAEILFFSAGLTHLRRLGSEPYYMRAASATGALYPIELYVVCGDLQGGLKAGVYHFNPLDFALTQMRSGDHRAILSSISGDNANIMSAPVTIIFTSIAWRNAWKYGARSYRHWFWDCGVIIANLLATCRSEGLRANLISGFVDGDVDRLLGLRKNEEATIALIPIGAGLPEMVLLKNISTLPYLQLELAPISSRQESYPEIWKINEASSLSSREQARSWNEKLSTISSSTAGGSNSQGRLFPLRLLEEVRGESLPLSETILRRGSTRRFATRPIPFGKLSWILNASDGNAGSSSDTLTRLNALYLIANAVDGLPSGSYYYDPERKSLELLKLGNFRNVSSYLCLEQSLFGDASVVIFLLAELQPILESLGNRGYRIAQLEAGVIMGRVYLSSYSLKLGASGSTFYDDAVTEFFSPHASGKSTMVAVGVGIPDYKTRIGEILVSGITTKTAPTR